MGTKRISIRPARLADKPRVLELWKHAGIRVSSTDDARALEVRLRRDRDLFLVACHGPRLVGSLIAGWDGWRAAMARLAVDPNYRREHIAQRLVKRAEASLRKRGAQRIGALVFADNESGQRFWQAAGYVLEPGITRLVKNL